MMMKALELHLWISLVDYKPTIWKILIEGVFYYVGVGMIEEFYGRGLFLNIIEAFAYKKDNKAEIAIIVSSVVFGLIDICALPYCFTQNMRYCSVQRKGGTELIYQKGCKPWRSITNKRLLV